MWSYFYCFNVGPIRSSNIRNNGKMHSIIRMITSVEDCELHENIDQNLSIYELLRNDIEDLGESSSDWWHEELETKEAVSPSDKVDSKICDCRSPVFKTPQLGLQNKQKRKSHGRVLSASPGQKRSRVTSPGSDGSLEMDWYSPFKSSKLSPIPPLPMGTGTIPKSLEPLLQEGSDISWNSEFVTPVTNSVTRSSLNSTERKVLMPTSSSRNVRVLFSPDKGLDVADCSEPVGLDEVSRKDISDSTFVVADSVVDKRELNTQDSLLSSTENTLCSSVPKHKVICKKNIHTSLREKCGNVVRLEEMSSPTAGLSMDMVEKCNETKDSEKLSEGMKSHLSQYIEHQICFSGSTRNESQYSKLRKHSLNKSPDSCMNDFTENSVEIDFGKSSPVVGNVSAGLMVSRRLFHGDGYTGVRAEGEGCKTQLVAAASQLEEDSGAVACGELGRRFSGSLVTVRCSQDNPAASSETEVIAASSIHLTQDFPQDLSFNTLEEICQVTELLAAGTETPTERPQCFTDSNKNIKTPGCVLLSSPDKSCLGRTSTPIVHRNKDSKFDSGKGKKRIKFMRVPANEKPNRHEENVRIEKENIQKQNEFSELPHGSESALEQATDIFKSSDDNSVVDIASRVQTIKMALNQIKKFTYVPASVEIKVASTQDKGLNVFVEDIVKSAQAMENVMGIKASHNDTGKLNISNDKQGFIPFCKLQEPSGFVTKGKSAEDLKKVDTATYISDGTGKPDIGLRSSNPHMIARRNIESSSIAKTYGQAVNSSDQDGMKEFIDVDGGMHAECNEDSSAPCHPEACGPEEQSGILIKDLHDAERFQESFETEELFNASDVTCDRQEHLNKPLEELASSSKKEMEFYSLNQSTKMVGFKTGTGKQIRLSKEALHKAMRLMDDIMAEEKMHMVPDIASKVPGDNLKCEELKDTNVSAVHSSNGAACEQSNVTTEDKSDDVFDKVSRQEHILNKKCHVINSPVICHSNINKPETVMHTETKTHQNYNQGETVTEDNVLNLLGHRREQENMMTDSEMVFAAEHAELMQQLAEDGSIFSEWPSEVCEQGTEKCEKVISPPTETKFSGGGGSVSAEQKETFSSSHANRNPPKDVGMSDGKTKSLFNKLAALPTFDSKDIDLSGQDLQKARQLYQKKVVDDGTIGGEKESSACYKTVPSMKVGGDVSINEDNTCNEEVHMEAVLNASLISELFSDSFEGFKIENRVQMPENKPENNVLNINHSEQTTPGDRIQKQQPEVAESDMSHDLIVETVIVSKSGMRLSGIKENMTSETNTSFLAEYPEATELPRAIGRKPSLLGTPSMYTLEFSSETEDKQQKSENIQTVDFTSDIGNDNKLIKVNTAVSRRSLLEKMGGTDNFEINSLLSSNDNCAQEPVTCTRRLFEDGVEMSVDHLKLSGIAQNHRDSLHDVQSILNSHNALLVDSNTAVSGRNMDVSAKAIRNVEQVFSEIDANIDSTMQIVQSSDSGTEYSVLEGTKKKCHVLQRFTTASGKNITVSSEALSKAKLLFSGDEFESGELGREPIEMEKMNEKESSLEKCKTTNVIRISDALNTSSLVISEANTTTITECQTGIRELKGRGRQDLPVLQCFKTSNGNKTCVSIKALNRAKLPFLQEETRKKLAQDETRSFELNESEESDSSLLRGFSTESGKRVLEPNKDLNTANLFLEEEITSVDEIRALELKETNREGATVLQGFSTASGKRVPVSAKALNRAKMLFSEEEPFTDIVKDETEVPDLKEKEEQHPPILQGFSTASGKRVSVSAKALNRAKLLFSEEEPFTDVVKDETRVPELEEREEQHVPVLQGFSTASGKRVSVSAKALNRAKLLFSDEEPFTDVVKDETKVKDLEVKEEQHPPILQGFSTASGKRVSVSAKALNRAKLLFSEEGSGTDIVKDETEVPDLKEKEEQHPPILQGFSTASGKRVSISAKALNRAKLLFSEEGSCTDIVKDETEVPDLKEKEEQHPPILQGFSTASGKRVSVSAKALNRAKLLFSEEGSCTDIVKDETKVKDLKEKEEQHPPILQGFSTASGKRVSVSAKALNRAKLLFSEEGSCTDIVKDETKVKDLNENEEQHPPILQGFSTASGKRVSVSAKALNRAKLLFSEEGSCTDIVKDETKVKDLKENEEQHPPILQGFSTASGKRVSVSAKALNRAKMLFSEEGCCTDIVKDETEVPDLKEKEEQHPPILQGFSTASGKRVSVSAKALNRAKLLFSEEGSCTDIVKDETEVPDLKEKEEQHPPILQGFSTASGKRVSVSAKALNRAKLLFSEEGSCTDIVKDETEVPDLKEKEEQHPPILQGFSTASGKRVSVSAKALNRAKLLFSEEGSCTDIVKDETKVKDLKENEEQHPPILQGFSTASGKRVSVSAKALNRAKLLFSEEGSCTDIVKDEIEVPDLKEKEEQHPPILQGFSTASGKRVSVSAKALNRAKLLFSEEGSCTDIVKDETEVPDLKEKEEQHPPILQGFSTASGKRVSVSAKALNRAKLLFSEEGSCTDIVKDETEVPDLKEKEEQHPPILQGFSTASGKRVSVSAKALNRAKLLFSEEGSCTDIVKDETEVPDLKEKEEQHPPILQGFSTASGKRVSVSAKALNRAKLLFSEEGSCTDIVKDETEVPDLKEKEEQHPPILQGFSTASGKRVSVSAKALNRAKLLFSEEESFTDIDKDDTKVQDFEENKEQHSVGLLESLASNGKGTNSAILNKKTGIAELRDRQNHGSSVLQGSSTVSCNSVCTSLDRAKVLISEAKAACMKKYCHEENGSNLFEKIEMVSPTLQGLSPASGKHDSILGEALNRDKQFISVEESGMCTVTSETNYLEFEKSLSTSESPLRLKTVSISKDKPRIVKPKFFRKVSDQKELNVLFKVPHSKQINSFRPFFLNESQREMQGSEQNTCISEETCPEAETLNGFMNTPDVKRNLQHRSLIRVHDYSTDITGTKMVNNNERDDLGIATSLSDCVSEEYSKRDQESMSLTQEVKESAAALLADEAVFSSPAWIVNYMSCPDILYDRDTAPAALVCSEVKDCSTVSTVEPGSPVLGSHDRCRKRQRVRMAAADDLGYSSHTPTNSSFRVPYKDTAASAGDISTPTQLCPGKRTARHLEFGTPFVKRLRMHEPKKKAGFHEPRRNRFVLGEREVCPEVVAGRQAAAEEQAALIRNRMSSGSSGLQPCRGSYYVRKQEQHLQMKLREAVQHTAPGQYTCNQLLKFGLKESVIIVSAENAIEFRFSAWDYYSQSLCQENITGLLVGDGARLVLDAKGTAGVEEVTRAFLSSPGIEPTLVPAGWVSNHYRWLVWKFASLEHSFPQQFAARCLTPNMLLLQLRYRYDREIDLCQRPAIRKILECDDSAAKRLVLCVARIIRLDSSESDLRYELELTDGWYSLTAVLDQELCQRVHRGTVAVGTKLISYGAELLNCKQGCSPLEVGSDVKLKLCSNSTRRARWDTKLGFHIHPGPLPISLTSILPAGGVVSRVSVTLVRVYPLLYVEKLDEGRSVSRSVWAEQRAAAQWEQRHQYYVEKIYSEMKVELHQEESRQRNLKSHYHIPSAQELALICSGDKLCEILELAPDPASIEALLNEEQKIVLADYERSKHENTRRELEARVRERMKQSDIAPRNVTPLLRVRCVDPAVPMSTQSAMLSVWRPPEDVIQLLKEGTVVTLFGVSAVGVRNGDLKLSAGRQTVYQLASCCKRDFHERRVMRLSEVRNIDFHPPFGELDVVGMVAYIGSAPQGNVGFQTVYLADTDFNVLGLAFWGGVKQFGWEEVLKPRALIAASNLQWRHGAAVRWVPCAYVSELSSFSVNPCHPHLQQALASLRQEIGQQDFGAFCSACEDKVSTLLHGYTSPLPKLISGRTTARVFCDSPRTGVNQGGFRSTLSGNTISSPKSVSPQMASVRDRTSLLSSPSHVFQDSVTYSSNIGTNSTPVERRIHKLQQYGEPPPLSPFLMIPVKPALRKEFHVPLRKTSPVSSSSSSPLSLETDPG